MNAPNMQVLAALGEHKGVFAVAGEEAVLGGNAQSLLKRLLAAKCKVVHNSSIGDKKHQFHVEHYAGRVTYQVRAFSFWFAAN